MKLKNGFLLMILGINTMMAFAQKSQTFELSSPDKKIVVKVEAGATLKWSVHHNNDVVLAPSEASLKLGNGEVLGPNMHITASGNKYYNRKIEASFYKKKIVNDEFQELVLKCKGNWGIIFRAYNDGVAYRFYTQRQGELTVADELASFNFDADYPCFVPYVCDLRENDIYTSAFESLYDRISISQFKADSLAFIPLLANIKNGKKVALLEADLQDYPGMFLTINKASRQGFQSRFAHYPAEERIGGFENLNMMVSKRADYIAKVNGTHNFPWRVALVSASDKDLLNSDMVYRLSEPSKINDTQWIKPGKVAWDWWNNWNISHVDFKAGVNTQTYKYYIDFAAKNGIEYIVMDEGWSVSPTNVLDISPDIDLKEIIAYGRQKKVDVILWACWRAIDANLDAVIEKYSAMGVKGFKIDFIDRDDQKMVKSCYEIARKAAEHKLIVDFHGMYKPSGLQRTYPNVLNFEGVRGMENCKWYQYDAPTYEVSMPYIRMLAGPADYTPGAMRNASRSCFRPISDNPMSQGTRCHQMAMYVAFEAPLEMLCDNPTVYTSEQECTDFITKVPTIFDETLALDGKVGEYLALARKKDNAWYVGALTNWNSRSITIDFSFLGEGAYKAEIFKDGINADRQGTDYKHEFLNVDAKTRLDIALAAGGGVVLKITKTN